MDNRLSPPTGKLFLQTRNYSCSMYSSHTIDLRTEELGTLEKGDVFTP